MHCSILAVVRATLRVGFWMQYWPYFRNIHNILNSDLAERISLQVGVYSCVHVCSTSMLQVNCPKSQPEQALVWQATKPNTLTFDVALPPL